MEPMLRALGVVVWHLAMVVFPEKLKECELTTIAHKQEIKEDHGALWFNKACASSRLATCILDPTRARVKRKQWYAYLGAASLTWTKATSWLAAWSCARIGPGPN